MELYFCFIAYSLLIQGAVSSNPEIFTYLEDGSLEPRNTAINLGRERHHCVSNILKCPDGLSIKLALTPQPMNPPVRHTYYISNGGQSLHSEGYYVRRNFGKDFEVGVAYSDLLWTVNFFLEDGISSIVGFTWENKTGLAVYIDGILIKANSSAGIRVFTNPMVDPFQDLFIGKSNSDVQMSDVGVIVSNITHMSTPVRNESDMIKFTGAYDNIYYDGCASNAPTAGNQANARSNVEPAISDAFNCRKYCALNGRTYAFLKLNIGCECYTKSEYQNFAVELQVTQQCQNQWYMYRSGGMVFDPYFPIQLRIAISLPTNKGHTRPNETVTFTFTTKATEVVTYYVDYDDGVTKITREEKISYAWNSVGVYNISVTAITRLSNETKYILMRIEWHDEGSPPEVVSLKTDNNDTLSKEVTTYITGISKDVKNCTLNYGDGNFKEYKNEMELIFNRIERHRYDDIGFYLASFECENQFGKTKADETIVAIHPSVEHTYYQMFKDISIPLIGIADEANYKNLIVQVDGKEVSSSRQGNNITISSSVILFSGDHVLGLIGNGKTMFTKIFSVQKLISDVSINADVIHTQINQSLDFVFKVDKGDFLHIHIEYGDNREKYLFAPAIDFPVAISKTYSYADLGKFYVMMTVANDVNSQKVQQIVSIERPVQNVTIEAINTTVIGEATVFTLEVDMELTPAMPVQVAFQYGDGNTETVILGKQQTSPTLLVHHYTYNTYGIYKVIAAVGNNISSVVVSTVLQVGEHITFVDVYTDKDRVLEDENITFTVHCPRGVPIKLEIDTGDGNILTVHRPLLPNQYVDGIIPPSTTTRQPAVVDNGSGMVDGSGDNEGTDPQGVLARRKRETQGENIDTSGDVSNDQNEEIMPSTTVKPPNEDFTVVYAYPKSGKYLVKVKVSNKFNFAVTSLCPEIVVVPKESTEPTCNNFDVSITNTSSENLPLVKTRSEEINLLSETNSDCSANVQGTVVTRYTWSTEWKTDTQEWRPELEVCETEEVQSSLVIDPNTLWYGTYRLKLKAALRVDSSTGIERKKRTANDLNVQLTDTSIPSLKETESGYTYLQIIPTPLVAKIENNEEKRDATFWEIVDLNMAPSHDPDVTHSNKSGMNFHVFCYLKVDEPYMEDKTLEEMITASIKLANNSFDTAAVYETAACFEKYDKIWVVGYEILFPGDHGSMNDSLVFDMFVTKDDRVARAKAEIKIWSTNVSMDNALDAIDALLASGDTSAALMVIDMATDALNVGGDTNDTDAKNARAAMRGKLINVMGNVAEAVGNFDQLDKTAGALNKITVVQDEVTDDGRKKAAGALGSAASKADDLATDANLGAVTDMAQSMVGAAGNVLPFAEDEVPPTEEPVIVTTVQPEDLQPTAIPSLEEPSEPVEVIIPCCEREAGLCAWIEPPCIVIEEHERKSEVWDNVMCDSVHPDELTIIRDRYDKSKLAMKLNKFDQKKQTTTGGWNACLKIGNVIGKKQDTAGAETSIDTPKMKMKVASLDSGSGSSLGAFNVPPDVMGGLGGGSGATVLDTPNPFTYSDSASSVKGKVMTMAFKNPDGSPMKIANTTEPFNIWMPGKPELIPPPRNFTFLSSPDGATMNYHTVNITTNDTGLHLIIRPESIHDVYYIYVKYQAFPNETYYDWKGELPNKDKFDTNDTWKLEQLYYTVFPDTNSTRYNGTYRIGIILKETRLNLDQLSQANNFTYSMQVFLSGCRFWDNNKDTWSSEGCGIGNLTTIKETQCLCNHLTSFGGDFVVPPNTIDFNTVFNPEKFLESIPVFVTVISVIILYIGVLVWARKEDKKDLIKWGASPLEDNLPTDTYHYQMTVHTGVKKNATTTSSVSFILSGDECDSGVRRLYDGNRKEFPSGSIYNYILSVEQSLGPLTYLRIWHDNSGKGKTKSWHLNQIMMTDIQTGDKYFFLCGRWMAVEEDDGQVERILPVAGLNDLAAFKHLFASSVRM